MCTLWPGVCGRGGGSDRSCDWFTHPPTPPLLPPAILPVTSFHASYIIFLDELKSPRVFRIMPISTMPIFLMPILIKTINIRWVFTGEEIGGIWWCQYWWSKYWWCQYWWWQYWLWSLWWGCELTKLLLWIGGEGFKEGRLPCVAFNFIAFLQSIACMRFHCIFALHCVAWDFIAFLLSIALHLIALHLAIHCVALGFIASISEP